MKPAPTLLALLSVFLLVEEGSRAWAQSGSALEKSFEEAKDAGQFGKAGELAVEIGDDLLANDRANKAIEYYRQAVELTKSSFDARLTYRRAQLRLGEAYLEQENEQAAFGPLLEAQQFFAQEGYDADNASALIGLARVDIGRESYKDAGERLLQARALVENGAPSRQKADCYRYLAQAYRGIGQYENAIKNYERYGEELEAFAARQSNGLRKDFAQWKSAFMASSNQAQRDLVLAQKKLQEEVDAEEAKLDSLQALAEEERIRIEELQVDVDNAQKANRLFRTLLYVSGGVFVIIVGFSGALFFFYRKNRLINAELAEQKAALEASSDELLEKSSALQESALLLAQQNEELESAKEEVERSGQRLLDSVRYAEQIQSIILPDTAPLDEVFSEHFVVFRPKDIVSGDFYWLAVKEGLAIVAAVDCTGHGVPGGFMSMIGSTLLNELVNYKYIHDPAYILNELHSEVRKTLKQESGLNDDGMDVSLVMVEERDGGKHLTFSGAKRPLYLVRNGEIEELKANKKSIGGMQKELVRTFDQHEGTRLLSGDTLFLTTDGFADQNNDEREKFGRKRLIETFTSVADLPADEQRREIEQALDRFQGAAEQRDDITVIGLKV